MNIGTVKEILNNEGRVGINLETTRLLIGKGHTVYVEKDAGINSGISNEDYINAGATLLDHASEVWEKSELIVKVKAPLEQEYKYFRLDLTIFCYLHLAADLKLVDALLKAKTTAIAFETIETEDGSLPALRPMSAIAGRLGVLNGAMHLTKSKGGSGLLVTGLSNINNSNVVIIGAGNVGINAVEVLVGFNTNITVLNNSRETLKVLKQIYKSRITTLLSTEENLKKAVINADLIISAPSIPGACAPKLIKREYYKEMKKGSVIVDIAIDQGGSTEVSRPTTHENPTFTIDGIIHYCVPNIPGDVPLTATVALNEAIREYVVLLADKGIKVAIETSKELALGVNIMNGQIINEQVRKLKDL